MLRVFIFFIIFSSSLFAQDKYLIYFKDKGEFSEKSLSKSADIETLAKNFLSEKSIDRRKKLNSENYLFYEDLPVEASYINKLKRLNIKIIHKLKWFNAVSAILNETQLDQLSELDFISKIDKAKKVRVSVPPANREIVNRKLAKTASNYSYDYGNSLTQNELSQIPAVHDMGFSGDGVIIGLLDTGYDWENHRSLRDRNVIAERDFIYNDNETANDSKDVTSFQHNHGTSVFSILAGFDEGNIIGPAFNSQFLLAKTEFVPTETHSEEDNYAAALQWMDSIGVDITTSSLGYSDGFEEYGEEDYTYEDMDGRSTIVTKAAEMAFERGIVVITSAGNEGNKPWKYITAPADGINTIAVGAVSSSNNVVSFSSEGPSFDGRIKPEIVAMGSSLINARAGTEDSYSIGSGTSFSAPVAAGVAGLLLGAHPHLNNRQVRSIMMKSGDNTDSPDNERGYGLISAMKVITFPNLEKTDNGFRLHKIFPDSVIIDQQSVKAVFQDSTEIPMTFENNKYSANLLHLTASKEYDFYFEYKDLDGNEFRSPADQNYKFNYGELLVEISEKNGFSGEVPSKYQLFQNYPNPFNPDTRIRYYLPESHSGRVTLKLFNILGAEVKTIVDEVQGSGNYTIELSSEGLSSGVYFYQLKTKNSLLTRKLMILK